MPKLTKAEADKRIKAILEPATVAGRPKSLARSATLERLTTIARGEAK